MKRLIAAGIAFLMLGITSQSLAQQSAQNPEITSAEEAVEWLKSLYSHRDYEYGALEGDRLADEFESSIQVEALRIVNMARANRLEEAKDAASLLVDNNPDHEWANYAKAVALRWDSDRREEAIKYIERGLEIAPEMSELHSLHIALLNALGDKEKAFELTGTYLNNTSDPIQVMSMRAYMLNELSGEREDITRDDVFDYYAEIRDLAPDHLSAHFFPGIYHMNANQISQAKSLLETSTVISTSPSVYRFFWQSVMRDDGMTREEKISTIEESIHTLIQKRPETPGLLGGIANIYNSLNLDEKQKLYSNKILENYPDTEEAEWVLAREWREFRSNHSEELQQGDEEKVAQFRELMWNFLDRPVHQNTNLKGEVYMALFFSYGNEDGSVDTDTLRILLDGMVEYNTINPHRVFVEGPALYAEKGGDIEFALELAGEGFEQMKATVEQRKEWGGFDNDEEYEEALDRSASIVHNALGWIHFHAGDLETAEEHLVQSHNLNSDNRSNLYRLGRLYEALEQPENAESYYLMGLATTGMGENPSEEALKDLFDRTRGSLDGFDDYLERMLADDRESRKENILAARHEDLRPALAFELNDIDGNSFHSDKIDNKITAVNFWGKWCGPCVAEMPDIQELHEKYLDDEDVVILTINNDIDLADLIEWLEDHEYSFPVLRDDGYISSAGVSVFPTTWFIDRDGEIVYTQIGYTSELVEEFSWRIEELRGD